MHSFITKVITEKKSFSDGKAIANFLNHLAEHMHPTFPELAKPGEHWEEIGQDLWYTTVGHSISNKTIRMLKNIIDTI